MHEVGALVETPQAIADYITHIGLGVQSLDEEISDSDCFPATEIESWNRWRQAFDVFYTEHQDLWPRLWGSAMDSADRWKVELDEWRQIFRHFCNRKPRGVAPAVSSPQETGSKPINWALIAGLIGVPIGAYLIYRMVKT